MASVGAQHEVCVGGREWRAVAQAEVNRDQPAEKRNKRLQDVIADIIEKFPPKKK